jgi:hypothetical protein
MAGEATAPQRPECEQGRDRVELSALEDGAPASCSLTLPQAARGYAPLAITFAISDLTGTTMPDQVDDEAACDPDGAGFYYLPNGTSTSLVMPSGDPVIGLCPDTCEEAAGDVTLEVLYGCEPTRR